MPAQRLPWIKLWRELMESEKIRQLSDGQYRTWTYCLLSGNQQPIRWRFDSLQHAAYVTRRPMKDLQALVAERFLEERPDGVWIHDATHWQDAANIAPTARERPAKTDRTLIDQPLNADRTLIERRPNGDIDKEGEEDKEKEEEKDLTPLDPPRGRRAKPAHEKLTEEERAGLVEKWTERYGSVEDVEAGIAGALNNNKVRDCKSERIYVDNWLRRGLEWRPGYRNGHVAVAEPECTCDQVRANLAINRNSYRDCEVHGRVE